VRESGYEREGSGSFEVFLGSPLSLCVGGRERKDGGEKVADLKARNAMGFWV
jgi:hypothetical protein